MALAHDFILRMPDGYDTVIGEKGVEAERRRAGSGWAIARAILKNAPILILDEATSALDTESEAFVQAALGQSNDGTNCVRDCASPVDGEECDKDRGN